MTDNLTGAALLGSIPDSRTPACSTNSCIAAPLLVCDMSWTLSPPVLFQVRGRDVWGPPRSGFVGMPDQRGGFQAVRIRIRMGTRSQDSFVRLRIGQVVAVCRQHIHSDGSVQSPTAGPQHRARAVI